MSQWSVSSVAKWVNGVWAVWINVSCCKMRWSSVISYVKYVAVVKFMWTNVSLECVLCCQMCWCSLNSVAKCTDSVIAVWLNKSMVYKQCCQKCRWCNSSVQCCQICQWCVNRVVRCIDVMTAVLPKCLGSVSTVAKYIDGVWAVLPNVSIDCEQCCKLCRWSESNVAKCVNGVTSV